MLLVWRSCSRFVFLGPVGVAFEADDGGGDVGDDSEDVATVAYGRSEV